MRGYLTMKRKKALLTGVDGDIQVSEVPGFLKITVKSHVYGSNGELILKPGDVRHVNSSLVKGIAELPVKIEVADRPVTRAEYRAFCESTGREMPKPGREGWGDDKPVTYVSHQDAEAFCEWAGVRLPTEQEWLEKIGDAKIDSESVWEHVAEMENNLAILRGGSWFSTPNSLRAAYRCVPDSRLNNDGFRVVKLMNPVTDTVP